MKIKVTRHIKDFILITAGIFSAAFGFKGFLMTNHFIDGGATGISLLISALTPIPLYLLLIVITVITRLELSRLNMELEKIDPQAFIVMSSIKDTKGGMIKKRAFKH